MMNALVAWLHENAPDGGYVNRLADVDGFYRRSRPSASGPDPEAVHERWGFELSAPASKGMRIRTEALSKR
ncbi:MAG: hypothetical protein PPP55_04545 [Halorubrum sp.]